MELSVPKSKKEEGNFTTDHTQIINEFKTAPHYAPPMQGGARFGARRLIPGSLSDL
jgi:hypothetical protein